MWQNVHKYNSKCRLIEKNDLLFTKSLNRKMYIEFLTFLPQNCWCPLISIYYYAEKPLIIIFLFKMRTVILTMNSLVMLPTEKAIHCHWLCRLWIEFCTVLTNAFKRQLDFIFTAAVMKGFSLFILNSMNILIGWLILSITLRQAWKTSKYFCNFSADKGKVGKCLLLIIIVAPCEFQNYLHDVFRK